MLKHAVVILTLLLAQPSAQMPVDGDWPMFPHDAAGTGRSPLTQISAANVATLASACLYRLQAPDAGGRPLSSEATPIVVVGVMYLPPPTASSRLSPRREKKSGSTR
jgi:glucose dehydrogenase